MLRKIIRVAFPEAIVINRFHVELYSYCCHDRDRVECMKIACRGVVDLMRTGRKIEMRPSPERLICTLNKSPT